MIHSIPALKTILVEPKNALIKQYQKLFEMDGIALTFTDDALDYIVEKAVDYQLGARGLRSLCETILTDDMFDLPGTDAASLVIDLDYVSTHLSATALSKLRAAS